MGVVLTANKTLIISTSSNQIYKVTQKGTPITLFVVISHAHTSYQADGYEVAVLVGSGEEGRVDGRADKCQFNLPYGMAVDELSHSCFVTDMGSHSIRKMIFNG